MTSSAVASIDEIAQDTYRIKVAVPDLMPGGFSFNQYLVVDDKPLLFHTGPRKLYPVIRQQIETVLPVSKLRFIGFSHVEADECGGLADFLSAAPGARPVCSEVAAMVSVSDLVDVEPLGMADGQTLDLGRHKLVWQSTPHLPHGWECGYFFDATTGTLFCGASRNPGSVRGRSSTTTSSRRAKRSASRWITTRTRPTLRALSRSLRTSRRRASPACMAARGKAMGAPCCGNSPAPSRSTSGKGMRSSAGARYFASIQSAACCTTSASRPL